MTWSARKRAWEARRLAPALERSPERKARFSTISDTAIHRLYGPWSWQPGPDGSPAGAGGPTLVDHRGDRLGPAAGRRPAAAGDEPMGRGGLAPRRRSAGRAALHPRDPSNGLPKPAVDDADV